MSVSEGIGEAESRASVRLTLSAVVITLLFASLGQTIVTTAMPVMVADLGGAEHITWVLTSYLLASTIGAPVAGKLGDVWGRKVVIQAGILIFVAGATLAGFAQNMTMLIAARLIQGLAGGGLIVVSMAVVADVLPPRELGKAQGMLGAAFGVSTVIGPLLGGLIVSTIGWHWIFFVNFPIGLVAFIVLGFALPATVPGKRPPLDVLGAGLLATTLSSVVLAANLGGTVLPYSGAGFLSLVGLGGAALAAFIAVERRAADPILPLELFKMNAFLVSNVVGFLVGMAMFGTIAFMPPYLQVVQGMSPAQSGLFLAPMMVGLIGSSWGAGQIMSRTGRYKALPIVSTALLAGAMLWLSFLDETSGLTGVVIAMVMVGLGLGPVFAIGVAAIQNAVPRSMLGVGTASANMFRLIGGSVGTAGFGAVFAVGLTEQIGGALPEGASVSGFGPETLAVLDEGAQQVVLHGYSLALHPIFLAATVLALLATVVSLSLREMPLESAARA